MTILAALSIIGVIYNIVIPRIMPVLYNYDPPIDSTLVSIFFLVLTVLFLISRRGIGKRRVWGKRLGQLSISLLTALTLAAIFISIFELPGRSYSSVLVTVSIPDLALLIIPAYSILFLVSILIIAQFLVPAYMGIRYLDRLPLLAGGSPETALSRPTEKRYSESPLPFSYFKTVILVYIDLFFLFLLVEKIFSPILLALLFSTAITLFLVILIKYNKVPSRFEQKRSVIFSSSGFGAFSASKSLPFISFLVSNYSKLSPFYKLLVYEDGLEMRFYFQRYFIPYDRLEARERKKRRFLTYPLEIHSDLPGVPERIALWTDEMDKLAELINEKRTSYMYKISDTINGISHE